VKITVLERGNTMKLRLNLDDWREELLDAIQDAESESGVVSDATFYNDAADQLCEDTLERLGDAGITWERAHQQSVGTHVIVQTGTESERAAFDAALHASMPGAIECLRRLARSAAEAVD